ncbi:MAG: HK97 gp10 family phage protein [Thermoplasmatales archaeon]|nr:HK97 gp10 family phage protein [Thermoplasmatales archaeon]
MIAAKIIGFEKLQKTLNSITEEENIDALLKEVAFFIEKEAKRICPVDTGRLRSSITTEKIDKLAYAVGTNVEYAPYVEFGTYKMMAQPYLRPAMQEARMKFSQFKFRIGV